MIANGDLAIVIGANWFYMCLPRGNYLPPYHDIDMNVFLKASG